jgi:hypothetical protein
MAAPANPAATPTRDAPGTPPRWWAAAAVLLVAAYAAVVLGLVATRSNGAWDAGPAPIVVPATGFALTRGGGHAAGNAFVVDALDASGTAVLAASVTPFPADRYPRVEWNVAAVPAARPELAFLWRTREQPERTFALPLRWQERRIAPLEPTEGDGWSGTVTGVALAVRAPLAQPLALESLVLPGVSAGFAAAELSRQWATPHPLTLTSITFPFDDERYEDLSLLAATALAQGLAIAGYLVLARRRRWPIDRRVIWALFLGGWLVLDARWQVQLWRQHGETAREFAGKTDRERHLADADHELYALMHELRAALPAAPVRILFLSDNLPLRERGAFFLYPHSVNAFALGRPGERKSIAPDRLHAGDYVLLFLYAGVTYDRGAKALVWPDGRRRAVEEVLWKNDGLALLRVR